MKYFLLLILLTATVATFSQPTVLSKIAKTGTAYTSFIPDGYDTLATASGDLNKDGKDDAVLVVRPRQELEERKETEPDSESGENFPERLLIILFRNGKGGFDLAAASDSAIMCKDCGGIFGDPFAGISVEKGILLISHYGGSAWRWSYTHKFRFQQHAFFLIGQTRLYYWNVKQCEELGDFAGTEYEDVNFLTGGFERKRISEECKLLEDKKGKQAVKPLVRLDKFSIDGM